MRAIRLIWVPLVLASVVVVGGATRVPSSLRSRAAVERVRPTLVRTLAAKGLRLGDPIFVRIFKESSELEVWVERGERYYLYRTYPICALSGDLGPKLEVGDLQSPEGFYYVTPGRMNPTSRFHLSFDLGYPNAYDRAHHRSGSALMVHGDCVSVGCFAMTDSAIEEIYALAEAALREGQPFFRVHAFPFRMTAERMRVHRDSPWRGFWENLKDGHDLFGRTRRPPDVGVERGRYIFADPPGDDANPRRRSASSGVATLPSAPAP